MIIRYIIYICKIFITINLKKQTIMSTQKSDSKAVELIYQDTQIHYLFSNDENVMINATEMAKAFGKRVDDFTRLESTEKFISILLEDFKNENNHAHLRDYNRENIISSNKKRGTYMHRYLAIKFAAWLDQYFEVWITKTIDEILFGKAKNVASKISEAEQKKLNIAVLTEKVRKLENEDVNKLLLELDDLKKIENERKKAVRQFSSQYKMF